ncbi:unnamed protein product [Caenorhabditis auriculariae]|uniref:BZIP domain-containing protein n=1 Tax=Caenorhabditis auriculariae TaxID=2777116 RepID=A0A8S1GSZ7_9PELO|nr:unnamed protein product [Caenorhabditis auriculariae]
MTMVDNGLKLAYARGVRRTGSAFFTVSPSVYGMILKDLETADKAMKKEPEETPPSSVDASPLQVHIPPPILPPGLPPRVSSATSGAPSPYGSPLGAASLLPPAALAAHPSLHHLNGDLSQLQPGALDFAAAIAAAAGHQNGQTANLGGGVSTPSGAGPSNVTQGLQMNDGGVSSAAAAHVLKPLMDPTAFVSGEPQNWHSPLLSGYSSSPSPTMPGMGGGRMGLMPGEDDSNRKRQVRLLKNREAAKECRRKKKEYVKCLENRVAVLENQNKALIEELKTLKELYCRKEKNEIELDSIKMRIYPQECSVEKKAKTVFKHRVHNDSPIDVACRISATSPEVFVSDRKGFFVKAGGFQDFQMANWMSALPESRKKAPFSTLKIPGSHNSGAYDLRDDLPMANDQNFNVTVRQMGTSRFVRKFVKKWSETQIFDVYEQLEAGVRYLDIRLELMIDENGWMELMLVHGLYGPSAMSFFEKIRTFLDSHPQEVVVLDINHVYTMTSLGFIQFVVQTLLVIFPPEIICPTQYDFGKTSLQDIVSKGYRLIIVGPYQEPMENVIHETLIIHNPWPDKNRIDELVAALRLELLQPKPEKIHVLQGVITPRPADITRNMFSSLREVFSEKATVATLDMIARDLSQEERKKINVVLLDQVNHQVAWSIITRLESAPRSHRITVQVLPKSAKTPYKCFCEGLPPRRFNIRYHGPRPGEEALRRSMKPRNLGEYPKLQGTNISSRLAPDAKNQMTFNQLSTLEMAFSLGMESSSAEIHK